MGIASPDPQAFWRYFTCSHKPHLLPACPLCGRGPQTAPAQANNFEADPHPDGMSEMTCLRKRACPTIQAWRSRSRRRNSEGSMARVQMTLQYADGGVGAGMSTSGDLLIGVDIGGTFTDIVVPPRRRADADPEDPDHAQAIPARRCCRRIERMSRAIWGVAPQRHRALRARHHGRHQRGAGAQGREDRPDHHRGLPRRARDRPPDAPPDVRPASARTGDAGVPGARRAAQGGARAGRRAGRGARAARRGVPSRAAADELVADGAQAIAVVLPVLVPQPRARAARARDRSRRRIRTCSSRCRARSIRPSANTSAPSSPRSMPI